MTAGPAVHLDGIDSIAFLAVQALNPAILYLAFGAANSTGDAAVIANISFVALEAGQAEIVFVAVEAPFLAEVIDLGQVDVVLDIQSL